MSENIVIRDDRAFTQEMADKAIHKLRKYADGKRSVDMKATENQEWWRVRHWNVIQGETNEGKKAGKNPANAGSAWAVNSILNKHADIMDSFPKPNILAREAQYEEEAKRLSNIIPAILDQNDYEGVYRTVGWDFCVDGACITGVFWDSSKNDGLGDACITNVDVHNLFWQPGISNIQDSDMVFNVTLQPAREVKIRWPEVAGDLKGYDSGMITKYIHDDNIDTSQYIECVDCYYKKVVAEPVFMDRVDLKTGEIVKEHIHDKPVTVLHLAKIIGGQLAWASENEQGYERGFYEHGKYPFIVRRLFPIKDSVWGFGYLDIMKNPQRTIDQIDQAITRNALMKSKPRYWVKKNAAINKEEFANWDQEIVEVGTGDIEGNVKRIECDSIPGAVLNHYANKIDELKETSGNRDFSQGSTQSGVTAASAIAALQEAGSKLSRDINKELYRGAREEYELLVELIRQFYNEDRSFRIDGKDGGYEYQTYSNANIQPERANGHKAIFDIKISAEKQSPFSRAAQNETAKELYGLGLFAPENAVPALVCIDMMDFEGKDKIKATLEQNNQFMQQYQQAMQMITQLASVDPMVAQMAMQSGLVDPNMVMAQQQQNAQMRVDMEGTPEERAAGIKTDNSLAAQARERVARAAEVG